MRSWQLPTGRRTHRYRSASASGADSAAAADNRIGQADFNAFVCAWRRRLGDGSRVDHLTGASNGALNGEYWKITTTDGTRYFFGLNRPPGWAGGTAETSSTWTVPV